MARASEGNEQLLCSFCGKSQRQVKKLIAGPGVLHLRTNASISATRFIDEELTSPAQLDLDNLLVRGTSTPSSRLRRLAGRGEAHAVGGGLQPLQARADGRRRGRRSS